MSIEDHIYPLLSAYTNAPQWVKSAVGGVYSAIPLSWRRGAAYEQFRNVLADRDEIEVANYARNQLGKNLAMGRDQCAGLPWFGKRRGLSATARTGAGSDAAGFKVRNQG